MTDYALEMRDLVTAARRVIDAGGVVDEKKLVAWKSGRGIRSSAEMLDGRRRREWLKVAHAALRDAGVPVFGFSRVIMA